MKMSTEQAKVAGLDHHGRDDETERSRRRRSSRSEEERLLRRKRPRSSDATFRQDDTTVQADRIITTPTRELSHTTTSWGNLTLPSERTAVLRVNETTRLVHFGTIFPLTSVRRNVNQTMERMLLDSGVYKHASAWLACQHLNHPEEIRIPTLRDRLSRCDITFSLEMMDSRFSGIVAAKALLHTLGLGTRGGPAHEHNDTDSSPFGPPVAVIGAESSSVSVSLSYLASAYGIPLVSSSSTSIALDNKETHPLFARTVPSIMGDAQAMAKYFEQMNIVQIGILYSADEIGSSYNAALIQEASNRGIDVCSTGYDDEGLAAALGQLVECECRYVVGILEPTTWKSTIREALKRGIIGQPGYTWLLSEASSDLLNPSFTLDRETEQDLARALHGTGILTVNLKRNLEFDGDLYWFSRSKKQQNLFVEQLQEPHLFDDYPYPPPGQSLYQYLTYDAVMALGIASCESKNDIFTGQELYDQLLRTEFQGVSGTVSFDPETGTRRSQDFQYKIDNLVLSNETRYDDSSIVFESKTSVLVDLSKGSMFEVVRPFVYSDSTTTPPPALPPLNQDENLIPTSYLAAGLTICSLIMLMAIGWMAWTLKHRHTEIVRNAQPIFLCLLCVGTLLIASAGIPFSFQNPMSQISLDVACMAGPWLVILGFTTALSALFSKTWRLNKLFKHGLSMRRIIVRPADVILPAVGLLTTNVALLAAWTAVAPLQWTRVQLDNYDTHFRSQESYGICKPESTNAMLAFIVPIAAINLFALVFALLQAWEARRLPTELSESFYIAVSMASLLETIVVAVPIVVLTKDDPPAFYLVRMVLLAIICLAVLLPIFMPKYAQLKSACKMDVLRDVSESFVERRPTRVVSVHSRGDGQLVTSIDSAHNHSVWRLEEEEPVSPNADETVVGRMRLRRTPNYYEGGHATISTSHESLNTSD